jgi:hypothetical protein
MGAVSEVEVYSAWNKNKKHEESAQQHLDLVVLLQQETRHSNSHVVAARTIRVTVLLEVFTRSLISQNL